MRSIILVVATLSLAISMPCLGNLSPISHPSSPAISKSIQTLIKSDQVLLDYNFIPQENLINLTIIGKNSYDRFEVAVNPNFKQEIQDFHELIQQFTLLQKSKQTQFINSSYYFFHKLLEPYLINIGRARHLIVIGNHGIQYLPFELLIRSNEFKDYQDLSYLIKDYHISYHLSLETFHNNLTQGSTSFKNKNLAFAPIFKDVPNNEALASIRSSSNNFSDKVPALPYSEKEVKSLFELWKTSGLQKSDILLHQHATKSALQKELSKPRRFIHIATHSFADFQKEGYSGVLCSGGSEECAPIYEILYAHEIEKLNIQAELVVLSSCQSGIGKLDKSGLIQGIHKSFITAGSQNVVFSMWKVQDQICQQFMLFFYEAILEGKSYSEALREAKLQLLQEANTATPNLWAPFLIIGK